MSTHTISDLPLTLPKLLQMHESGEKIAVLTCYDASFASLFDYCGVDCMLVGDSLGMVLQGHTTTLPVSNHDMAYHTACVARAKKRAWLIADMPFGAYGTIDQAFNNAVELMQAGAQMVKLEGGSWLVDTVKHLTERSIPVCAHLGLTPQSVHQLGGFKVQGKTDSAAEKLKADALALQKAGATMLVLEAIPAQLAKEVTQLLNIPTIGIGAGVDCSGQVLVMQDMLGIGLPGAKKPRFVKNFMTDKNGALRTIEDAVKAYVLETKSSLFPESIHTYS